MKRKLKKIVAMLLTLLLLSMAIVSPSATFAAEQSLQWEYICFVSFNIFFQITEGSVCATVDFYDECLYAQGRITVYEEDGEGGWTRIATMVDDTLDVCLAMVCFFESTAYVEYYATFELTAHGQYSYETEFFEDYSTCPPASG